MANLLIISILSTMKELSIQIKVHPVTTMRQEVYHFMAEEFEFTPLLENSEAGYCFNCNKDVIISLPPSEVTREFIAGRFAIVEFTDTKHRAYLVGDKKIPAIVSISPHLNTATLKIESTMLYSPLL